MKIIDTELAWAAGFYDGEGSSGAYANGKYWKPCLQLDQRESEPLERFADAVGVGAVGGPYPNGGWSQRYCYRANSFEHIQHIACVLWRYLSSPKREQLRHTLSTMIHGKKP